LNDLKEAKLSVFAHIVIPSNIACSEKGKEEGQGRGRREVKRGEVGSEKELREADGEGRSRGKGGKRNREE